MPPPPPRPERERGVRAGSGDTWFASLRLRVQTAPDPEPRPPGGIRVCCAGVAGRESQAEASPPPARPLLAVEKELVCHSQLSTGWDRGGARPWRGDVEGPSRWFLPLKFWRIVGDREGSRKIQRSVPFWVLAWGGQSHRETSASPARLTPCTAPRFLRPGRALGPGRPRGRRPAPGRAHGPGTRRGPGGDMGPPVMPPWRGELASCSWVDTRPRLAGQRSAGQRRARRARGARGSDLPIQGPCPSSKGGDGQ